MSSELFEALNLLEKERGIQVDFMVDKITKAILTACKNSYDNEDARVEVNPDKGAFDVYLRKEVVDEVLVMIMKGPHTYTGEDTVEIDCHGGVYAMKRVLETVLKNGAIIAEPGEFTKRAFLNG